jgi:glycosyltransferase involved in cell wall biosynthesis
MSVYHKEKPEYLEACLDSMIKQTLLPNEIVLIKDGPLTPELDRIIEKFVVESQNLFNIVVFKENIGLGKALPIGVEHCKYDLIARMDTDDIARKDRFEIQIREFRDDEQLDIVGSHILEFDKSIDNILARRIVPLSHDEIVKFSKKRNPYNHMTVMYKKKSVIEAGNYRHVYGLGYEDYDLWVRMLMNGCKAKNIDDFLVHARTGVDMFKRRGNKERLKTALYFRKKMYQDGFTNFSEFMFSSVSNIVVSSMPSNLRAYVYKKFLRN